MREMTITSMSDKDVERAVARILEIMGEKRRLIEAGNRSVRFADHRLVIEENTNRTKLAAEFGRRNGWQRARRTFTIEELAGRKHHNGRAHQNHSHLGQHHELFDHAYCYRELDRPYRAAAVAAHLYNNDARNTGNLPKLAEGLGLALIWPDFPSWWFPGHTNLALITPLKEPLRLTA